MSVSVGMNITLDHLPKCPKCEKGDLLPFIDFIKEVGYYCKGWVCSNCDHNIVFRMGELYHIKVLESELPNRK